MLLRLVVPRSLPLSFFYSKPFLWVTAPTGSLLSMVPAILQEKLYYQRFILFEEVLNYLQFLFKVFETAWSWFIFQALRVSSSLVALKNLQWNVVSTFSLPVSEWLCKSAVSAFLCLPDYQRKILYLVVFKFCFVLAVQTVLTILKMCMSFRKKGKSLKI